MRSDPRSCAPAEGSEFILSYLELGLVGNSRKLGLGTATVRASLVPILRIWAPLSGQEVPPASNPLCLSSSGAQITNKALKSPFPPFFPGLPGSAQRGLGQRRAKKRGFWEELRVKGGPGARNNPIRRGQPGSILPATSPVSQPAWGAGCLSYLNPQAGLASLQPTARGPR